MTGHANQLTARATPPAPAAASTMSFLASDTWALVEGLGRLGYDIDALLNASGLSRAAFRDPDARISCEACGAIFVAAQQARPMRNLSLHLAQHVPIGAFPLIDYLVVTAETVGDGLKQLGRYFKLSEGHIRFEFYEDDDPIRVVLDSPIGFNLEFLLSIGILHMRGETDGRFTAMAMSCTNALDDPEEHVRVLHCPVHDRAAWSGWLIARDVWRLPLRRRDSILRGVLERHADALVASIPQVDGIIRDVRRALATRIAGGDASIEAIARELATAPRTLQRRLSAAGSSFQALVEQTRREAAERYLAASTLSIAEIGYLLGYSEAAAFHRAFKRWNGETPHAFRRRRP
jgi:AraC-like DNA-binding protein